MSCKCKILYFSLTLPNVVDCGLGYLPFFYYFFVRLTCEQELAKDYKQVVEEEEEEQVIEHMKEPSTPKPAPVDTADVLGQGAPGKIFRSTLSHPHLKKY